MALEINSSCNRKCRYCPNYNHTREPGFLEEQLSYKIIDELKDIEFDGKITFNLFNEPLLDKRLPVFIKDIRKNLPHVYIYLNTNGDLLDLHLWEKLRKVGLDFANVTQYDGKVNKNIQKVLDNLDPEEREHFCAHTFDVKKAINRAGLVDLNNDVKL